MTIYKQFHDAIVGLAPLASACALVRDDGIDPLRRLAVYANAYFARIHGVLVADYPKLHALLGDDAFRALVVPYLRAYPTRHPSLREAGAHLARFLDEQRQHELDGVGSDLARPERARDARGADVPLEVDGVCADLARLERARVEAFDGADAAPLTRDDLAALPPEAFPQLRLRIVPTAILVDLTTNADDLWDAIEEGRDIPAAIDDARSVLVWRRDLTVVHRTLDPDERAPLHRLATGATFADICELVQDVERALALLLRWLDAGALVSDTAAVDLSA